MTNLVLSIKGWEYFVSRDINILRKTFVNRSNYIIEKTLIQHNIYLEDIIINLLTLTINMPYSQDAKGNIVPLGPFGHRWDQCGSFTDVFPMGACYFAPLPTACESNGWCRGESWSRTHLSDVRNQNMKYCTEKLYSCNFLCRNLTDESQPLSFVANATWNILERCLRIKAKFLLLFFFNIIIYCFDYGFLH